MSNARATRRPRRTWRGATNIISSYERFAGRMVRCRGGRKGADTGIDGIIYFKPDIPFVDPSSIKRAKRENDNDRRQGSLI